MHELRQKNIFSYQESGCSSYCKSIMSALTKHQNLLIIKFLIINYYFLSIQIKKIKDQLHFTLGTFKDIGKSVRCHHTKYKKMEDGSECWYPLSLDIVAMCKS